MKKHLQIGFLYLPTAMPKKARGFSVLKLDQMQSEAVECQQSGTLWVSAELDHSCQSAAHVFGDNGNVNPPFLSLWP